MTRINLIPPEDLHYKHLIAEYRELPRVYKLARAFVSRGGTRDQLPQSYRIGKGHVQFFYDKLLWLSWRHIYLVNEMERRGYQAHFEQNLRVIYSDIPNDWWNDWYPEPEEIEINQQRISDRLATMKSSSYQSPSVSS